MRPIQQARVSIQAYKDANADRTRVGRNDERDTNFTQLLVDIDRIERDRTIPLESEKMKAIHAILVTAETANNGLDGGKTSKTAIATALRTISEAIPAAMQREQEQREADAELARQQEAAASIITNPVELIADHLRKGRIHLLNPQEIVPRVIELIDREVGRSALTPHEKQFRDDLDAEFLNRQLSVSPGIVHLLAKSPLGKRYAELTVAYEQSQTKGTRLPLTTMVRTIGEIVRVCMQNQEHQEHALQDLHQLFIATDEKELSLILKTLTGKGLLHTRQLRLDGAFSSSVVDERAQRRLEAVQKMHPNLAKSVDMKAVDENLAALQDGDHSASADGVTASQLQEAQAVAIRNLHFAVRLSSVLSDLLEQISLSTRSHIAAIQDLDYDDDAFADRLRPAAQHLQPQFAFLQKLLEEKDRVLEYLTRIFNELNEIERTKKRLSSTAIELTYQAATQKLVADQQRWKAEFADMRAAAVGVLSTFTHRLSSDPVAGMAATEQALGVAGKKQAHDQFLRTVAADITAVRNALEKFETSGLVLPEAHLETQVDARLSLDFVVRLANRFSSRKEDFTPAIELVQLLLEAGLFTPQIQSRMLHQANIDGLLGLQKFLKDSAIRVNETQLNMLWNVVLGTPNFEMLKPLQRQLALSPEVMIALIQNLSSSWQRSLPMLTAMFQHEGATPEAFVALIKAAKGDDALVENVFEIYSALVQYQPLMVPQFFAPKNMSALIEAIQTSEQGFTDELVLRLENSQATSGDVKAPFTADENWAYVLRRTAQYDARGLSYAAVLAEWQAAGSVGSFDDYSRTTLGRYAEAIYRYATQINVQRAPKSTLVGEPSVVNTDHAQRDLVCASVPSHFVDYQSLSRMTESQSSGVNLSDEQQLFLHMMRVANEMALQNGRVLVVDSASTPSLMLSTPTPVQLDAYTFLVLAGLSQKVAMMSRLTTEDEKIAAVASVVREANEAVGRGFAESQPMLASALQHTLLGQQRREQQQVVHHVADGSALKVV